MGSIDAFMVHDMGTKNLPESLMGSFTQQIFVQFTNDGAKAIRILFDPNVLSLGYAELISKAPFLAINEAINKHRAMAAPFNDATSLRVRKTIGPPMNRIA